MRCCALTVPVRKVMEEMCPSPVARRLRMKRSAPLRQSRLVGMRHDGRIEQRRGLRRILVREVSADEHLPFGRRLRAGFEMNVHLLEAVAKNVLHLLVPVRELAEHLAQQPGDLLLREGHDPGDDPPRDVIGGGIKRPHQHPRAIRGQGRPDAFGVDGTKLFGHEIIPAGRSRSRTRWQAP